MLYIRGIKGSRGTLCFLFRSEIKICVQQFPFIGLSLTVRFFFKKKNYGLYPIGRLQIEQIQD